jgi:hypothetical protein
MTWVRVEESSPFHPKFIRAGCEAYGWWVAAMAYCNRHLSDGFIPVKDLPHVFPGLSGLALKRIVDRLVAETSLSRTPKGYLVHDFLDYQPSRESILATRKVRAEAGRSGGVMSGESRRSAKQMLEANAKQMLEANEANREARPARPVRPVPSDPTDREREPPEVAGSLDAIAPTVPPPAASRPNFSLSPPKDRYRQSSHDDRPEAIARPLQQILADIAAKNPELRQNGGGGDP